MISIINNILTSNGYDQVDIPFLEDDYIYLFCPSNEFKREEYFVTLQLREQSVAAAQSILTEKAQDLFDVITNSGQVDLPFEKNCTLLICHDEDKIDRQTILALEEDVYNFKKNVIIYTKPEVDALHSHLAEHKIEVINKEVINEIIHSENGKNFLDFKSNHRSVKSHYSLILKIVLKLPFITYSPQEQKLINLSLEIESSLSEYQFLLYKQLLDTEFEWSEDNIYQNVEKIWGDLV